MLSTCAVKWMQLQIAFISLSLNVNFKQLQMTLLSHLYELLPFLIMWLPVKCNQLTNP